MLRVDGLYTEYPNEHGEIVKAAQDVSFTVPEGKLFTLLVIIFSLTAVLYAKDSPALVMTWPSGDNWLPICVPVFNTLPTSRSGPLA